MENYALKLESVSISEKEKNEKILAFLRSFSQIVVADYMTMIKTEEPKKLIKK